MKNKSILNSCLLLNMVQLFVSGCATTVKNFGLLNNILVRTSLFALQIFVWIMFTMHIFVKNDYKKKGKGFIVGLVAVLPAVLLTIAGALSGHFSDANSASWLLFSFLGSALSFYNKSAIILTNYVPVADAYLIFCINYAVMIICATVGGLLGAGSNISLDKKKTDKQKQEVSEQLSVTKILDDLEEKENNEEFVPEEDEKLNEVVLDEVYDEETDESTVATVISMPVDDDEDDDSDSGDDTVHEAISIISVDVDELEDEAEDMFKKRYDEMAIDDDFDAMKAEADGLLVIASEINNNIDGIITEIDTILQSDKVGERTAPYTQEPDEIDMAIADVFEEMTDYEEVIAGETVGSVEVITAGIADEISIDIPSGEEPFAAEFAEEDLEITVEPEEVIINDINIEDIELTDEETIEVEETVDIFAEEDEELTETSEQIVEESEIGQEELTPESASEYTDVTETAEEVAEESAEVIETAGAVEEESEKTFVEEILSDEISIEDIIFEDEETKPAEKEETVDPQVAQLVKALEEKRLAERRKKQKEQDFDNWLNRKTTKIDTNEIREALRKAGIKEDE